MPSEFDNMALVVGRDPLLSHFADRLADGAFAVAKYYRGGRQLAKLSPFIVSQVQLGADVDLESGDLRRRETRMLTIDNEESESLKIGTPSAADTVVLPDGETWAVDLDVATVSERWTTIGLARTPTLRQWEGRRNADI